MVEAELCETLVEFWGDSGLDRGTVKISVPDYLRSQHVMNNTTKHWFIEFLDGGLFNQ
jgi:hypothetical protein